MEYVASLLATFKLTERLIILYEAPFIAYPDGKWMMAQLRLTLTASIWLMYSCKILAMKSSESETNLNVIRLLIKAYPMDDMHRKLQYKNKMPSEK